MLIRSTHHPPSPGLTWRTFRGNARVALSMLGQIRPLFLAWDGDC
jgi:hypothetical protein